MSRYNDYLIEREERGDEDAFIEYDTNGCDDYDPSDDPNAVALAAGTDHDCYGDNAAEWEV